MESPYVVAPTAKNGGAIPKDTQRFSSKVNSKGNGKGDDHSLDSSLLDWIEEKGVKAFKSTIGDHLQKLESEIKTREQFDSLYVIAKEKLDKVPDNDGKLNSGNLVSALGLW